MEENNNYSTPIYMWAKNIANTARMDYGLRIAGCNVYLYIRPEGALCCALLYGYEKGVWREIVSRRAFSLETIPSNLAMLGVGAHNITDALKDIIIYDKQQEGEEMKDGLKKVINTTLGVAASGDMITEALQYQKDPDNPIDPTTRVSEMARAALNQDWFDLAKLGFEAVIDLISDAPLTYADFVAAISQYVDAKITEISTEEGLRFVGGECHLSVIEPEKKVETKVELYFKNEKGSWIKKELSGQTDFEVFSAETLDGEIANILMEGGRKFPVTPPEK